MFVKLHVCDTVYTVMFEGLFVTPYQQGSLVLCECVFCYVSKCAAESPRVLQFAT